MNAHETVRANFIEIVDFDSLCPAHKSGTHDWNISIARTRTNKRRHRCTYCKQYSYTSLGADLLSLKAPLKKDD